MNRRRHQQHLQDEEAYLNELQQQVMRKKQEREEEARKEREDTIQHYQSNMGKRAQPSRGSVIRTRLAQPLSRFPNSAEQQSDGPIARGIQGSEFDNSRLSREERLYRQNQQLVDEEDALQSANIQRARSAEAVKSVMKENKMKSKRDLVWEDKRRKHLEKQYGDVAEALPPSLEESINHNKQKEEQRLRPPRHSKVQSKREEEFERKREIFSQQQEEEQSIRGVGFEEDEIETHKNKPAHLRIDIQPSLNVQGNTIMEFDDKKPIIRNKRLEQENNTKPPITKKVRGEIDETSFGLFDKLGEYERKKQRDKYVKLHEHQPNFEPQPRRVVREYEEQKPNIPKRMKSNSIDEPSIAVLSPTPITPTKYKYSHHYHQLNIVGSNVNQQQGMERNNKRNQNQHVNQRNFQQEDQGRRNIQNNDEPILHEELDFVEKMPPSSQVGLQRDLSGNKKYSGALRSMLNGESEEMQNQKTEQRKRYYAELKAQIEQEKKRKEEQERKEKVYEERQERDIQEYLVKQKHQLEMENKKQDKKKTDRILTDNERSGEPIIATVPERERPNAVQPVSQSPNEEKARGKDAQRQYSEELVKQKEEKERQKAEELRRQQEEDEKRERKWKEEEGRKKMNAYDETPVGMGSKAKPIAHSKISQVSKETTIQTEAQQENHSTQVKLGGKMIAVNKTEETEQPTAQQHISQVNSEIRRAHDQELKSSEELSRKVVLEKENTNQAMKVLIQEIVRSQVSNRLQEMQEQLQELKKQNMQKKEKKLRDSKERIRSSAKESVQSSLSFNQDRHQLQSNDIPRRSDSPSRKKQLEHSFEEENDCVNSGNYEQSLSSSRELIIVEGTAKSQAIPCELLQSLDSRSTFIFSSDSPKNGRFALQNKKSMTASSNTISSRAITPGTMDEREAGDLFTRNDQRIEMLNQIERIQEMDPDEANRLTVEYMKSAADISPTSPVKTPELFAAPSRSITPENKRNKGTGLRRPRSAVEASLPSDSMLVQT